MYGFSGYGTNVYATPRQTGIIGPVVILAMRILRSTYGIPQALLLRFRNSRLTNPQTNNTTLEL
jgi:hypothetical protein